MTVAFVIYYKEKREITINFVHLRKGKVVKLHVVVGWGWAVSILFVKSAKYWRNSESQ
jgi:hypothetical protein